MTHLTEDEVFVAAEAPPAGAAAEHLRSCATCAAQVQDLRTLLADLRQASEVPEPSPFFWHAFGARVRAATASERVDRIPAWRRLFVGRGAWIPAACAAGVMLFVLAGRLPQSVTAPPIADAGPAIAEGTGSEQWADVLALADGLSADEARDLVPLSETASLEDLTALERHAFVQLLHAEMAGEGRTW